MFGHFRQAVSELREGLAVLDPGVIDGPDAAKLLRLVAQGERLCAMAKTLLANRVERTGSWQGEGHASLAEWLAEVDGTSVGSAVGTLQTARDLQKLPATEAAARNGELSASQAREIASAAKKSPKSEKKLIKTAKTRSAKELRQQCLDAKASACRDEATRHEEMRRSRYFRSWTDFDGAGRIDARLTPDALARVLAGIEPFFERIVKDAKAQERYESDKAHRADALVAMTHAAVGGSDAAGGPKSTIHFRVDHSAFVRGHTVDGEACEIPGIGPVPVSTVRAAAADAILYGIVTKGVDVTTIAHLGRTIPSALRIALEHRDPVCRVAGCPCRDLEIHHKDPVVELGLTSLENLVRICKWHHYLITHCGYTLEPIGDGDYRLIAPDTRDAPVYYAA